MTGKEGGEIIVSPHLVPITISCVKCVYLNALCVCVSLLDELFVAVGSARLKRPFGSYARTLRHLH